MKAWVLGAAMALVLMTGKPAPAAEATTAVDLNSAYVWRGITFNDGLVAQPSIDVSKNGFGINVWGNFDIGDYNDTLDDDEFSEIDITLYYGFCLKPVNIGLGFIEYLFPAGGEGTREAYVSLELPVAGGLSFGATAYYDVDEVHGWYGKATVSYGLDLTGALGLEVSAAAGCADKDYARAYGGEHGGWYDYGLSLGISYAVTDALSLGARINYTDTLDDEVLTDDMVDTSLYGGVGVAYAF